MSTLFIHTIKESEIEIMKNGKLKERVQRKRNTKREKKTVKSVNKENIHQSEKERERERERERARGKDIDRVKDRQRKGRAKMKLYKVSCQCEQ